MKVLIWIGFFIAYFFLTAMIRREQWGGIPTMILFGSLWWAAISLCRKWDKRKNNDEENGDNKGENQ